MTAKPFPNIDILESKGGRCGMISSLENSEYLKGLLQAKNEAR